MPIDLLTATQDALVAVLRAQLPANQRDMVDHSLEQDRKPPFHLIGDIDTENVGGKFDQAERLTVDLHTIYQGTDRRELLALMHPIRVAIDDAAVTQGGVRFRFGWLGSAASTVASDGVTYAGVTLIEVNAEPA